jgi:hypothetical protein
MDKNLKDHLLKGGEMKVLVTRSDWNPKKSIFLLVICRKGFLQKIVYKSQQEFSNAEVAMIAGEKQIKDLMIQAAKREVA